MGGSIGFSTPVATGAAVACPDRKVICMVGDGSAMYTLQSLWTQAREGLNVVTIVFANRIYQILRGEFDGVGAGEPGQRALDMLKIDRPALDFVALAKGMGVPGRAVTSVRQGAGRRRRRAGAAADRGADVTAAVTACTEHDPDPEGRVSAKWAPVFRKDHARTKDAAR
jgi:thiamine pyrophosphate-dependent acetolactate synthase large subunit-like protein